MTRGGKSGTNGDHMSPSSRSFWVDRRVFVTGATGLLESYQEAWASAEAGDSHKVLLNVSKELEGL